MTPAEARRRLLALAAEWEPAMVPTRLLVRAWLYSAIAEDAIGGMPLDDILCVATLRYAGIHIDELGDMYPAPAYIPCPLAKRTIEGEWIYATSNARLTQGASVPMVRCKRKHFVECRYIGPKLVDTSNGKYRSFNLQTAALATPYLEWTVEADAALLRKLLPLLPSLGRARNTGLGSVQFWELQPTTLDPCVVDGVPQRAMPCPSGDLTAYRPDSCSLGIRSVRPPHIFRGYHMQCAVPLA